MIRLLLFSLAGFAIFSGFAVPFVLPGFFGVLFAVVLIALGGLALWLIDWQTKAHLDRDALFNRVIKVEGDELLPRSPSGRDVDNS